MKKKYWTLRNWLPLCFSNILYGNRSQYGCVIQHDDADWMAWEELCVKFYHDTQKRGVGGCVNNAGYEILGQVDFEGKDVFEMGPGCLPHLKYWKGVPLSYSLADRNPEFLDKGSAVLEQVGIRPSSCVLESKTIPIDDSQFDIVVSFFSLEHLYPLNEYLIELSRILRPGGVIVGAIPCEGGLAWGCGRLLTSSRYIRKNSNINISKIICWGHPNFSEHILENLDINFTRETVRFWLFRVPVIDLNLVIGFVYRKML